MRGEGEHGGGAVSVQVLSDVWTASRARGSDLLVLLALADQADDSGECWPSVRLIADRCRIDERTAQRRIRALEALGEVVVTRGGGRAKRGASVRSNRYRIVVHKGGVSPPGESPPVASDRGTAATQRVAPVPPLGVAPVPPESLIEPSLNQNPPTPTAFAVGAQPIGSRSGGTNPRALGTNPRATSQRGDLLRQLAAYALRIAGQTTDESEAADTIAAQLADLDPADRETALVLWRAALSERTAT